jgi:LPS sulfotransferase NodH
VVLGAERTGSNLLVDMLSTHPHIVSAGELFNTRMMAEDRIDTQLPPGLDPIAMLELRKRDPAACLERVLAAGNANGATAAGFKLLYLHALACNPVVDHLLALPDLRIVHLAREDRLARWVSQVRAELADTWWIAADPSAAPRRTGAIDLDATATLWNFEWQELLEERLRATFAGHSRFDLSYEQLSGDLQGQAGRVLDYLGVEPQPLEVNSAKSGERDPRQWIANLAQLHLAFAGTRWQSMFAQPDRPRLQETAGPARLAGCGSAAMVAPEGANEALELIQRRFDDLVVTLGELTAASETLREELRSAQRMLRASQAFDGDALTEPSETSRN